MAGSETRSSHVTRCCDFLPVFTRADRAEHLFTQQPKSLGSFGEIDLRALLEALNRKEKWIIVVGQVLT